MGIKIYKDGVEVLDLPVAGRPVASQAEAEAGTDNFKQMTPLRTAQAIAALGGGGGGASGRAFLIALREVAAVRRLGLKPDLTTTEITDLTDLSDPASFGQAVEANSDYDTAQAVSFGQIDGTETLSGGVNLVAFEAIATPLVLEGEVRRLEASGVCTYNDVTITPGDSIADIQAAIRADGTGDGDDAVTVDVDGVSNAGGGEGSILGAGTPSFSTVVAGNPFSAGGDPWDADRPAWAQWDLGSGNSAIVTSYEITAPPGPSSPNIPQSWRLQASNDGSSWTDLDVRAGQSVDVDDVVHHSFSNSTAYRYHRLLIEETNTNGSFCTAQAIDFFTSSTEASLDLTLRYAASVGIPGAPTATDCVVTTETEAGEAAAGVAVVAV